MKFRENISRIAFSEEQIAARVDELAARISKDYAHQQLYLIVILKGAMVFVADLIRRIKDVDLNVDFMVVSSYGGGTRSTGKVRIVKDLQKNIEGRHALIIEDIVDTGLTMNYLRKILYDREPRSLATCSLLSKPSCRKIEVPIEYLGFEIPDEFVVGYGLDYDQGYRQLPFIGVLKPEVYGGQA